MINRAKHLSSVHIDGHAGFMQEKGDPVCAAVTVLIRTVGRYLQQEGFLSEVKIDNGSLEFYLIARNEDMCVSFAQGILELGLNDLMTEWPDHVKLIIKEKRR